MSNIGVHIVLEMNKMYSRTLCPTWWGEVKSILLHPVRSVNSSLANNYITYYGNLLSAYGK